jgi:hypothetical protein
MRSARVTLPRHLSAAGLRLVLKYFEKAGRMSPAEWKSVLAAFDALGASTVLIGKQRRTFQQLYDGLVDRTFAEKFIARLLADAPSEAEAEALQQETARRMLALLEQEGLYHEAVPGSEYLAAYCLYWWTAFARGYRFEVTVFRDLRASGIAFVAHDLSKRAERRSPYDLIVSRQRGDVRMLIAV